jgi:hypothetical protein
MRGMMFCGTVAAVAMMASHAAGVSVRSQAVRAAGPSGQAAPSKEAGKQAGGAGEEARLRKALLDAARKTFKQEMERFRGGLASGNPEKLYLWSRRWLDAELDVAKTREARVAAYGDHPQRMRGLEKTAQAFARSGQGHTADAQAAEFFRIQAELWLVRAKKQNPK